MKQTNNAIKFLMAQYRAIFKNANLKMFLAAATAAAALAAGSAQADAAGADADLSASLKDNASEAVDITSTAAGNKLNGNQVTDAGPNTPKHAKTITVNANNGITVTGNVNTVGAVTVAESGTLTLGAAKGKTIFTAGSVQNNGTMNVSGSVTTNSINGWYGSESKKAAGATLVLAKDSALTVTGADNIDLSSAKISTTDSASLIAEKSTVTLATGFEKKVPNVTASTIVAKGAAPASGEPLFGNNGIDKRKFLYIKSGSVTALNELKADPVGGEVLVYKADDQKDSSLTLGNDQTTNGKLTGISRVLLGASLKSADKPGKLEINGKWDFGNARLTVSNGSTANINSNAVVTNINSLQLQGPTNSTNVNISGYATVGRLLGAEKTGATVNVSGKLDITGDGLADKSLTKPGEYANDVQLSTSKLNIKAGGTVELSSQDAWDDVLKVTKDDNGISSFTVITPGGKTTDDGGWKKDNVTLAAGGTLRIDLSGYKVKDKKALEDLAKSLVSGDAVAGIIDLGNIGLAEFKPTVDKDGYVSIDQLPSVKTDATKNLDVKIDNATLTQTGALSFGSASVKGDTLTTAAGSTIEFNKAKDGLFATNNTATGDASKNVGISLNANSAVKLNGNGTIGAIAKSNQASGTKAVLGGENGNQTVEGKIDVADLSILAGGHVTVKGAISSDVLELGSKASIDAGKNDISIGSGNSSIFGDIDAQSLTLGGNTVIAGEAQIEVNALVGTSGKTIQIGEDDTGSGLGATVLTKELKLNGGSIFVDPVYGNKASTLVAGALPQTGNTGELNGDLYVGKNAAVGIGFDSQDEFDTYIAPYVDAKGSFGSGDGQVHNALVVNENITINSGNGIVLDDKMDSSNYSSKKKADNVVVEAGSNLIITAEALKDTSKAAITFGNAGSVSGAGTITLAGDIYSDAVDLAKAKLFQANGGGNLTSVGNVKVELGGGLYSTTLTSGGTLGTTWTPNKDMMKDVHAQTSTPVADFVLEYTNPNGGYDVTADNEVLNLLIDTHNWAGIDAAAHAATYAGAQQAAVAAVTTMAEAVGGRVGSMGVEASAITATGSAANGGVWVAPMYKSVDADGFGAQGVSYGADVDLAGVAFGADTVNGNMRFGAVFNIGSGDADGKGQGNGLKDEFDYYGFGIYSVMGFGQLALVGDASLNVISHDVEGLGLKGSADTTAVTMGVTGQYTISTPSVDVVPHIGARFIRLDTESYDLTAASGVVATTDFDVQNVFSVPLGVTLSKAFEMGGWSLAPSADLSITFNTGDTEAESTTRFAGVSHNIGLSTEVLDEVTYGVTVGLGAQYGAFGTNIGINYTGSENTDSFGVNAQARYMF